MKVTGIKNTGFYGKYQSKHGDKLVDVIISPTEDCITLSAKKGHITVVTPYKNPRDTDNAIDKFAAYLMDLDNWKLEIQIEDPEASKAGNTAEIITYEKMRLLAWEKGIGIGDLNRIKKASPNDADNQAAYRSLARKNRIKL